ncbi:uncharacterized protein LOC115626129 [Scaptodrosophila lebanonensis]|uniref:Uncharacterized protein LOC115626129 n=1 Tax=Drosophila lebanonensis TaxID=7225 RepID=A0A6J2TQL3_DROLE|nr:uncharacterized protein LOC115626129 [Scaptodrosophila lebanonensis]
MDLQIADKVLQSAISLTTMNNLKNNLNLRTDETNPSTSINAKVATDDCGISDDEESGIAMDLSDYIIKDGSRNSGTNSDTDTADESQVKKFEIKSQAEAIKYLRAMQKYAMWQENFQAIGLLMEAENVIAYPPDQADFELS